MELLEPTPRHMIVQFKSIEELKRFKKECICDETSTTNDTLTLLGKFTESQLNLAIRFNAMISIDGKHAPSRSGLELQTIDGYATRKQKNDL